ncbi:hypothetical protein HLB23_28105 [Nocardia uniformis]|uniref:Uncharacterized protein n=1 Tax=Nocardia uniformis TaxID=53432 RepID=A0A849CBF4_9NOCA|nr:hypothetical protein [Nocardia uniformis]NNH73670.1 hypothetical protein [Nocardia uniformis]
MTDPHTEDDAMTPTIARSHRARLGVTVSLIMLGLIAAGCGTPTQPAAPPPAPQSSAEIIAGIDTGDALAVMVAAIETAYTWQPGPDPDSAAGFDRARGLLTERYRAQVGATASGLTAVPAGVWARWASAHASITATAVITPDDHPADTAQTRQRVVALRQRVNTVSGTEPDRDSAVYVTATATPGGWRVSLIAPR